MSLNLLKAEFIVTLRRKRFWIAVLLASSFSFYLSFECSPFGNTRVGAVSIMRLFGSFSYCSLETYAFTVPMIAGLASAGSLAIDRTTSYPAYVLTRGISRFNYLSIKAAAMTSSTTLATTLSCTISIAISALFHRWGATESTASVFEPFPALLTNYPLINDLVMILFLSLAAAGLAATGLIVGSLSKNEYLAISTPLLITIGVALIVGGNSILVPNTYLWLREDYVSNVPPAWLPFAAPIYWLAFGGICFMLSAVIFLREESV